VSHTTTISFEHGKGNEPSNEDDGELCEAEIEVDLYYEPADREVGIMQGGWLPNSEVPDKCEECGHIYSKDERQKIDAEMERAAQDYDPDPEPPEPDYEEDLRNSLPHDDSGWT
jgi:hypothetical protein